MLKQSALYDNRLSLSDEVRINKKLFHLKRDYSAINKVLSEYGISLFKSVGLNKWRLIYDVYQKHNMPIANVYLEIANNSVAIRLISDVAFSDKEKRILGPFTKEIEEGD